jgi:tripartite-type tricarboxylate transporter receptor subunit TctC
MLRLLITVLALASAIAASHIGPAKAEDFYAGKTITLYAGFPPGGGVDGEMRILAQYYAKYIPGNPSIVARNMPGAGGVILGNFLYQQAPADGLTLGMPGRSGFLLSNVIPQKGISYDLRKFSYIGGAGSATNALWIASRTGVNSIEDLKRAQRPIIIGALTARSENAIAPKLLAQHEGWPLKVVDGYPGFNEVLIAIERGEVDGLFSHEGSVANTRPDMVTSGFVKAIAQTSKYFPNVPVLKEILPKDSPARPLLGLVTTPSQIGLPLMGPPGVPADRLAILRTAYAKLMEDAEYRAEADKRGLPVGRAVFGDELAKIIEESLANVPEAIAKEYMNATGIKPGN